MTLLHDHHQSKCIYVVRARDGTHSLTHPFFLSPTIPMLKIAIRNRLIAKEHIKGNATVYHHSVRSRCQ